MKSRIVPLILALVIAGPVIAKTKARHKAAPAQARLNEADKDLLDFSQQPFSDQGSHLCVLRKVGDGFASYDLISAMAFGSLAARPHAVKKLFNMRLELEVSGKAEALFPKSSSCTAEDFPRWSDVKARDGALTGEATLLYPETDALVLIASFSNHGKAPIKVRPRLVFSGGGEDVDSQVQLEGKGGVLSLNLDRSKLVQRKLVETVCVLAGAGKGLGQFNASSMKQAENLGEAPLVGLGGFTLDLSPAAFSTLKPGQVLRYPVALCLGLSEKEARLPMSRLWTRWALTKGEALGKARARWSLTAARLPQAVDPKYARLEKAAALTVLMSQFSRRSELKNDMFSQAKGFDDAFFSDGLPMIALGMSELDHGAAEAALLELTSFSAAAPFPVPPYCGEELLMWEASGLPMHGLASWELYQRDPELPRAGDFLKGMGLHLRNECAWWPSHRDGDGNGLYTYGSDEEKPAYLGSPKPASPTLQTYSVALSSLVAWQMQAAGALAAAAGEKAEADKLVGESLHIAKSLKSNTRSPQGSYEQGLDGLLPYILGLDQELPMARAALGVLTQSAEMDALPFVEAGVFHPWRAYWMLRGLCLYGEHEAARKAASKILQFLADKPFFSAYSPDGKGLGAPGDAASGAAVLEMTLERQEQDAFLLADTKVLSARMLQVRSQDGAFYLKRLGLGEAKAPYEVLNLSSPGGGAILTEGSFLMSSAKDLHLQLISPWGLDISEAKSKRDIFKATKHAEIIIKANVSYLVKILKS